MKKNYIKPTMNVVELHTEALMYEMWAMEDEEEK